MDVSARMACRACGPREDKSSGLFAPLAASELILLPWQQRDNAAQNWPSACGPKGARTPDLMAASYIGLNGVLTCRNAGQV
jgi:hypothetical protein